MKITKVCIFALTAWLLAMVVMAFFVMEAPVIFGGFIALACFISALATGAVIIESGGKE